MKLTTRGRLALNALAALAVLGTAVGVVAALPGYEPPAPHQLAVPGPVSTSPLRPDPAVLASIAAAERCARQLPVPMSC